MPDEDVTTLDVRKHAPESGKRNYPNNGTTTTSEANNPYTLTNNEPGRGDTGMANVATSSKPYLKAYSPFLKTPTSTVGNIHSPQEPHRLIDSRLWTDLNPNPQTNIRHQHAGNPARFRGALQDQETQRAMKPITR